VRTGVDHRLERRTGAGQRGEVAVVVQQVGGGGDEVGLGDAHRGLRAALGLGVVGDTGLDHAPVVAPGGHQKRVAHRQAGHPVDRHRPFVVGQQVRRHRPQTAQRRVQAGQQAGQGLVPGGDHHSEAAPGQPRAEQLGQAPGDGGARPPVELGPHPRLGHPRPVGAPMPGPIALLGLRHGPPGGALVAAEAHRHHVASVDNVGADLALGALDQLFDLLSVGVDDPRTWPPGERTSAGVTDRHVASHRVRIGTGETACRVGTAGQIECFENLHDLPVMLGHRSSLGLVVGRARTTNQDPEGPLLVDGADKSCPPAWRSRVRQRGLRCPATWSMSCPLSAPTEFPPGGHSPSRRRATRG